MRIVRFSIFALVVLFFSIGCSPESDMNDQLIEDQETNGTTRLAAKNLYNDYYQSSISTGNETPWSGDEPTCNPGAVPKDVKTKILRRLSYFRRAVGLSNELTENSSKSEKAQQAALMMHANNALNHFPPSTWKCYSEAGKEGAGNSLLTTATMAEAIDSYIRDAGLDNAPVGHRRWLLYPELREIGIGNTDGANAIWVLNGGGASLTGTPEYIAWPPKGFAPKQLIYPRWSFSLKNADFTNAQIGMKDADGNSIALSIEKLDDQFGDPTIVWQPAGVATNVSEDTSYVVSISGVEVNGEAKDFTYTVTIFDPAQ